MKIVWGKLSYQQVLIGPTYLYEKNTDPQQLVNLIGKLKLYFSGSQTTFFEVDFRLENGARNTQAKSQIL